MLSTLPHCTGNCAAGRRPCSCATGRPVVIATRPTWRARLQRWWLRMLAQREAARLSTQLQRQLLDVQDQQDELRLANDDIRTVRFMGSPEAADAATQQLKRNGQRLDELRAQELHLRQRLALLENLP